MVRTNVKLKRGFGSFWRFGLVNGVTNVSWTALTIWLGGVHH